METNTNGGAHIMVLKLKMQWRMFHGVAQWKWRRVSMKAKPIHNGKQTQMELLAFEVEDTMEKKSTNEEVEMRWKNENMLWRDW